MRNFPGTVSLSAATFAAAVREVVQEYVRHGARRLALYSGHAEPGQLEALREAVVPIVDADPALMVLVVGPYAFLDPVREAAGLTGRDGHAASLETSTLLALDPGLVRLDRVPDVRERPRLSVFRVAAHPETEFPAAVRGDTSQRLAGARPARRRPRRRPSSPRSSSAWAGRGANGSPLELAAGRRRSRRRSGRRPRPCGGPIRGGASASLRAGPRAIGPSTPR